MRDISLLLDNYRLTTAEIVYRLPDFPDLLQSYIWQNLDLAPEFPILNKFLDFWGRNLDGRLHSVRVFSSGILSPGELRWANAEICLQ
jgi:uncharacterized protein Usg